MEYSNRLKKRLLINAMKYCKSNSYEGTKRTSAFLFDEISMNFHSDSYKNICNQQDYKKRLDKPHSNVPGFKEMQSSNSSDVLLMNFFAHPRIQNWKSILDLFSISRSDTIEFGWNPGFENETNHKTEIDMKIGKSIFEAKLTENDFTSKDLKVVQTYSNIENIIDLNILSDGKNVSNYQLLRNLLTANKFGFKFYLLVDESRIDLIREFYIVKCAIKDKVLANNFNFITWQETADSVGLNLKKYITEKYF